MIWIIGGTSNATEICKQLIATGKQLLVSVTTDYGRQLSSFPEVEILQGMLNRDEMIKVIALHKVNLIVDASHPFATEVSQNAIDASRESNITYLRYERQNPQFEGVKYCADYPEVISYLKSTKGNILLTTGSKNVWQFASLGIDRLYARVLANADSFALCEKAGLSQEQIIGIQGVCGEHENLELMKKLDIRYLITKESGTEGGLFEKLEAAKKAGVEVIIIKRPQIDYPEVYSEYATLLNRIEHFYK
jgi:precorrin-6A/cobalt-precorrin-6A reductase